MSWSIRVTGTPKGCAARVERASTTFKGDSGLQIDAVKRLILAELARWPEGKGVAINCTGNEADADRRVLIDMRVENLALDPPD